MGLLPGGNALVGWGSLPYFTEFDAAGRTLLDVPFPGKDQSYRARFSSTWVGIPEHPPSAVARSQSGKTTVYVSWNGDTRTAAWQVRGGSSAASTSTIATKPRSGFETAIPLTGSGSAVYQVVALDAHGQQLGVSHAFSAR
jgi:hypothetical protein